MTSGGRLAYMYGAVQCERIEQKRGRAAFAATVLDPTAFFERRNALSTSVIDSPTLVLTILAVEDLERAVRFYRTAFGWAPRVETPVYVELAMADGRGLGLYHRDGYARNTGRPAQPVAEGMVGAAELYFHCRDLDARIAALHEAGAEELSPRSLRDWGDEAAYFADPDGNVLVVAMPAPLPLGS